MGNNAPRRIETRQEKKKKLAHPDAPTQKKFLAADPNDGENRKGAGSWKTCEKRCWLKNGWGPICKRSGRRKDGGVFTKDLGQRNKREKKIEPLWELAKQAQKQNKESREECGTWRNPGGSVLGGARDKEFVEKNMETYQTLPRRGGKRGDSLSHRKAV